MAAHQLASECIVTAAPTMHNSYNSHAYQRPLNTSPEFLTTITVVMHNMQGRHSCQPLIQHYGNIGLLLDPRVLQDRETSALRRGQPSSHGSLQSHPQRQLTTAPPPPSSVSRCTLSRPQPRAHPAVMYPSIMYKKPSHQSSTFQQPKHTDMHMRRGFWPLLPTRNLPLFDKVSRQCVQPRLHSGLPSTLAWPAHLLGRLKPVQFAS